MPVDGRRGKLPEVWTICRRCANEGACNPCEPVEVVPRSPSGLASILQGLDEEELGQLVGELQRSMWRWYDDHPIPQGPSFDADHEQRAALKAALSGLGGHDG